MFAAEEDSILKMVCERQEVNLYDSWPFILTATLQPDLKRDKEIRIQYPGQLERERRSYS